MKWCQYNKTSEVSFFFPFACNLMKIDTSNPMANSHWQVLPIKGEFLFCELLRICRVNAFNMVKDFFAKQTFRRNKNLGTLGLDGASVMLGNTSGSAALVKKHAPHLNMQWCQPVSTTLPTILKNRVYFYECCQPSWEPGLTHCYFKRFCQEMGVEEEVRCCNTGVS